jgi:hypothetical protein
MLGRIVFLGALLASWLPYPALSAVHVAAGHSTESTCVVTVTVPIPTERGKAYFQTVDIDVSACRAVLGPRLELSLAAQQRMFEPTEGRWSKVRAAFPRKPEIARANAGDPVYWARHSTWDPGPFETTYVHHRQSYTQSGGCTYLNWIETIAWWRNVSAWIKTGGPSQWVNSADCASASTSGWAAFDNPNPPPFCGDCKPCDHQLWSEIRSYGTQNPTASFSYSSSTYPLICQGWIHTAISQGME